MNKKGFFILLLIIICVNYISAQDKLNIKFGKISTADFTVNSPVIDWNSNAVIIADIGKCELEGNNKGWFTLIFTEHKRIKIINKNGFPAADINIGLYKNGNATEKIEDIKAITYNLENGSIVQTKLDEKNVFADKQSKNYIIQKFTFPAVKEGSIIEYSYTIKSDFLFHLHSWEFQGEFPCLWSSYTINIPSIFNYMILKQGSANYFINKSDEKSQVFNIKQDPDLYIYNPKFYVVNTNVLIRQWVMKDVPAMHLQDFTSSIENYVSKLEFQLSEFRFPDEPIENKMKDWNTVSDEMLKYDDFGKPMSDNNIWVSEELKNIIGDGLNDEQKARKIFAYVRDNYTCTRRMGIFLSEETELKDIIKRKTGSVSDLNLLLITMLRTAGLKAYPVILSTRDHGTVRPQYPMLQKFNYVICQLKINGLPYYLDASNPYIGFARLQPKCYNGMARIISEDPSAVYFKTDDLIENKTTYIKLSNSITGMEGEYNSLLGYSESLELRAKLAIQKQDDFFKEEEKKYNTDITIKNGAFDSLKNYDAPVMVKYTMDLKTDGENLIYLNPMLNELIKENPFKSEARLYPIELPSRINKIYNFYMEIPKGYKVEELPASKTFLLTDNQARFDYQIAQFPDHIQLTCKLQFNKTFFNAEDYTDVRQYFTEIIKKENEQIVFKKMP